MVGIGRESVVYYAGSSIELQCQGRHCRLQHAGGHLGIGWIHGVLSATNGCRPQFKCHTANKYYYSIRTSYLLSYDEWQEYSNYIGS